MKNRQVKPRKVKTAVMSKSLVEDKASKAGDPNDVSQASGEYLCLEDLQLDKSDMWEVLTEDKGYMKKGSIVQRDPFESFLNDLPQDDERRKMPLMAGSIFAAEASNGLCTLCPVINNQYNEEVECIYDCGSQIAIADHLIVGGLNIAWDPTFTINMQDAGGKINKTAGLARNVPFTFGNITLYLQLHIQTQAPFQVLLGRPLDILGESLVQNFANGDQEITLTDPNSGRKITVPTFPRGMKGKNLSFATTRYNVPSTKSPFEGTKSNEQREAEKKGNF